jgi:hypothetical protein
MCTWAMSYLRLKWYGYVLQIAVLEKIGYISSIPQDLQV